MGAGPLPRNGRRLTASEAEATTITLCLAAGEIDADAFAAWLRANIAEAAPLQMPGNSRRA